MTTPDLPRILLTRPRADSEALAEALGVPCLVSPILRIETLGAAPGAEALLLTSRNGVAAWVAGGGASGLPAWCVGPRTAEAARAAGLVPRAVAPDAATLAGQVPGDAPPLLHVRGTETRGDLAGRLRARGLRVAEAVLYDAKAVPLSPEARAAARARALLVPLYSPRSAALVVADWPADALSHLRAIALSPAVAEVLPHPPVAISPSPDGKTMVQTILATIGG